MTDKENKWIKFYPSLELPKERVSIAYATHDERGVRYAYGYFQFYNGTCGCFWKDGNEQPKVVKAEDIKYWMPVPSLDVKEEPVSEDLDSFAMKYAQDKPYPVTVCQAVKVGANWQKEQDKQWLAEEHKHIFAKGRDSMKQQMMKEAIEVPIEEAVPFGSCKWKLCAKLWLDKGVKGNKVKLIIIKEE